MITDFFMFMVVLGLLTFILQNKLVKDVNAAAELNGNVFSRQEIFSLQKLLLPLAGCLLGYCMLMSYMYGLDLTIEIVILILAVILEWCLGIVYIKQCIKTVEDFSSNAKLFSYLIDIVAIVPVIAGVFPLYFAFTESTDFPSLWLLLIVMIATFIPTFRSFPALHKEFKRVLQAESPSEKQNEAVQNTVSKPKKRCPYCGEEILAVAKKCKHCGEWLETK